jgi:transcriptional regulator with XRE-family HTH domain
MENRRTYTPFVGRPLTKPRPEQGKRLRDLRVAAGLSQTELAELVGERQQNIAYWEQSHRPPRSDVLPKLAEALGVAVTDLLDAAGDVPQRRKGPVGRAQRLFAELSELPRGQQNRILEVVSALMEQYKHS